MKAILQTRQPVINPGDGQSVNLIGGDFVIDETSVVANTAFGVFVMPRADIHNALILPDETDLGQLAGTLPAVMFIN